jgi:hypothetical protein
VWVISINESELDADGNPSVDGAKKRVFVPTRSNCNEAPLKKTNINKFKMFEAKESWISGKIELYYNVMEYKHKGVKEDNDKVAAFMIKQPLGNKISRRDVKNAIKTGGSFESNFTTPLTLFDEWEAECTPKNCFMIFYEHDPLGIKKSIVAGTSEVMDFEEDEKDFFINQSSTATPYITFYYTNDDDITQRPSINFTYIDVTQQELKYKTSGNYKKDIDTNRDLPFGVLDISRTTVNGIYNEIWSAGNNLLQPGIPRQNTEYSVVYNPLSSQSSLPKNNDRYRTCGSGIEIEYIISQK